MDCKQTNQIYRITPSGKVEYRWSCRRVGTNKRSFTPTVTEFAANVAKGAGPNTFVTFGVPGGSQAQKKRPGYPITIYKSKQQKKLLNVFGFAP